MFTKIVSGVMVTYYLFLPIGSIVLLKSRLKKLQICKFNKLISLCFCFESSFLMLLLLLEPEGSVYLNTCL